MTVLTMPSSPGFRSSEFGLASNTTEFRSPLSGSVQTVERPGARWTAKYTLPPMKREQAAAWQGFLTQLRGMAGRFYGFDPDAKTPRGVATTQAAARNYLRNGQARGAVAGIYGSGGAYPTRWNHASLAGLTVEIIGSGTDADGIGYTDIKISGTTSGTNFSLRMEEVGFVEGVSGQSWTSSLYAALQAGALTNISAVQVVAAGRNSVGTQVESTGTSFTPTGTLTRRSATRAMNNAATVTISCQFLLQFSSGVAIDATFRIGGSMLEQSASLSTYLPTDSVSRSRGPGAAVDGAGQTGSSLATMGWTVSTAGILKAGDFVAFDTAGGRELHILTADATSDAFGRAVLAVEPPIRTAPADNVTLITNSASCQMGLVADSVSWSGDSQGVMSLSFEAEERFF